MNHSSPELYGLSREDVSKMRLRYLKQPSKEELIGTGEIDPHNGLQTTMLKVDYYQNKANTSPTPESDLWKQLWLMAKEVEDRRLKQIKYEQSASKGLDGKQPPVDLQRIREIPLKSIFEQVGLREDQHKRGWYSCPLHKEKSSSFHIMPNSNRYKCFGCGATGSTIDFVMAVDKCTVAESIKKLSLMIY